MTTAHAVLDQLEAATKAAIALARELAAARGDADEWTRYPAAKGRCTVSGWSRSKIHRLAERGQIRRKQVGTSVFYSAADVRRLISQHTLP